MKCLIVIFLDFFHPQDPLTYKYIDVELREQTKSVLTQVIDATENVL